jgi:glucose-fructose oxidoreductase
MEFANGAKGEFATSYNGGADVFRAEGERGWFELKPAFAYGGLNATTSKGALAIAAPPSQQAIQIDDFAQCVRDGRETRVPGEMGRRDLIIIEAIYASAAQGGKRIEIKA